MKKPTATALAFFLLLALVHAKDPSSDGWQTAAPRDEIRPSFSFEPSGGPKNTGSWVVTHDHREGLDGWFQKSFAVRGGESYRFQAVRKTRNVSTPRRSALVRVLWQNEAGNRAPADVSDSQVKELGYTPGSEPEVARELSNRGAEVIAWPVWGCNPLLAQARACENHVYLVSSTFMEPKDGWMISAVFDRAGKPITQAEKWGTVAVAEVDLNQPLIGPFNLGDFRATLPRHRPVSVR